MAFYVASWGSDSNAGIGELTPFKTIAKAIASLTENGQTIYIVDYISETSVLQSTYYYGFILSSYSVNFVGLYPGVSGIAFGAAYTAPTKTGTMFLWQTVPWSDVTFSKLILRGVNNTNIWSGLIVTQDTTVPIICDNCVLIVPNGTALVNTYYTINSQFSFNHCALSGDFLITPANNTVSFNSCAFTQTAPSVGAYINCVLGQSFNADWSLADGRDGAYGVYSGRGSWRGAKYFIYNNNKYYTIGGI